MGGGGGHAGEAPGRRCGGWGHGPGARGAVWPPSESRDWCRGFAAVIGWEVHNVIEEEEGGWVGPWTRSVFRVHTNKTIIQLLEKGAICPSATMVGLLWYSTVAGY